MKRVIVLLAILFGFIAVPAQAENPPAIAVIDTGTNTALFQNNIVAEYCVLEFSTCANGKPTMEGPGAANVPATTYTQLDHGTQLISIMLKVNPNAKIIPIRIVGVNKNGSPAIYTNASVKMALDWVAANQEKYNIQVVNVAQGAVFAGCKVPAGTAEVVAALKAKNVPVIASTGNNGNRTAINSIACLPDVVSVGATDNPDPGVSGIAYDPKAKPYIARYSNGTPDTDFYLNGRWYVTNLSGTTKFMVGTSNATASLSAWWLLKKQSTFDATYAALVATTTTASNEWLTGKYIAIP